VVACVGGNSLGRYETSSKLDISLSCGDFSAASVDVKDDPLADTMCYFFPLREIFLLVQTDIELCKSS